MKKIVILFIVILLMSSAVFAASWQDFAYIINKQPINIYTTPASSFDNISAPFPSNCSANQYSYGFNATDLFCRADVSGGTFTDTNASTACTGIQYLAGDNTCDADRFNTSTEIEAVIGANASYTRTYNVSYDAQLGHNTTDEIFAALDNNTYIKRTNTTVNEALLSIINYTFHKLADTITWGNLSSWDLNNVWTNNLHGGNLTADSVTGTQIDESSLAVQSSWGINTSAEIEAVIGSNDSYTKTYNSTYDANIDTSNTSAEIEAVIGANLSYTDTYNSSYMLNTGDDVTGNYTFTGSLDVIHTSTEMDDHAVEFDVDAAGFGDVKALDINYITGAIAAGEDEGIILINIDETDATGGDVFGLEILATDGSAGIYGLKTGVLIGPIHQDSGTFVNPTTATNNTASTDVPNMNDSDISTTTDIFVADNGYIIIGAAVAFEEVEFILNVSSSNPGIKPTFWYSTTGTGEFTQFTPVDGTNGFRNTGVVAWDASDLTGHVADDVTTTFDIKIIRTQNSLGTNPILGYAKVAATTEYIWDKDGSLSIKNLTATGNIEALYFNTTDWSNITITESQISDLSHTTDTANTSAEIEAVIGANTSYTDTYNSSYDGNIDTANSSAEIEAVIGANASYTRTYNVTYEWFSNTTIFQTYNSTYDAYVDTNTANSSEEIEAVIGANASYTRTYNSTYDGNIDTSNTSAEIEAVIGANTSYTRTYNSTYDSNIDTANTTAEIRTAVNASVLYDFYASDLVCTNCISGTEIAELADADVSNTLTCSILTDDNTYALTTGETFTGQVNGTYFNITGCADNEIWKVNGNSWNCEADIDTDTANTSAEIEAVIGANTSYTDTYNSTYDANIDTSNTSEEIEAVIGANASYTRTYNVTYDGNINTANTSEEIEAVIGANDSYTRTYNSTYDGNIDTANTTEEMHTAINNNTYIRRDNVTINDKLFSLINDTYHKYADTITWANLSSWDLNSAWTNALGGGNLTANSVTGTEIDESSLVMETDWYNTSEEVQDAVMAAIDDGTQTLITVSYEDASNDMDFVVDNDLHSYDWTNVVNADITDTLTCSIMNLGTATFTGTMGGDNITDSTIDDSELASGDFDSITGIGSQAQNLDFNTHNATGVECIIFSSGGKMCSGT